MDISKCQWVENLEHMSTGRQFGKVEKDMKGVEAVVRKVGGEEW